MHFEQIIIKLNEQLCHLSNGGGEPLRYARGAMPLRGGGNRNKSAFSALHVLTSFDEMRPRRANSHLELCSNGVVSYVL